MEFTSSQLSKSFAMMMTLDPGVPTMLEGRLLEGKMSGVEWSKSTAVVVEQEPSASLATSSTLADRKFSPPTSSIFCTLTRTGERQWMLTCCRVGDGTHGSDEEWMDLALMT